MLGLVWLISGSGVKIVHGKDYKLFVFSLRSALFAAKPAIHNPSHTHAVPSDVKVLVLEGAGSTSSSAVSLTTNDMESRAAQAFATTTDWESNGGSTRRLDRRLSGTRTGVRLAESCAKRPTASRWWTRRSLTWCMTSNTREVQFAGDNGVVDTIALQDEADEKNTSSGMENSPNSA